MVGAPRSGTTSLSNWLSQHPEIDRGKSKEPGYYVVDLPMRNRVPDVAAYAAHFPDAEERRYRLDATPWYLFSEAAVPAIAAACPDAQLIVNLRSPATLLPSLHNHHLYTNIEWESDLATALFSKRTTAAEDFRESLDYMEVGRLGAQVRRLLQHFARDQVHFIQLRDLAEHPRLAHARLLGELGLEQAALPDYRRYNAGRRRRSKLVAAAATRIGPSDGRKWRRRVAGGLHKLNNQPATRNVPVEIKRRIIEELTDDTDSLAELTGFDLGEWKDPGR